MIRLTDSTRRGLRTAIDVVLSAFSSGLILILINVFKEPDLTVEQFTVVALALTPVLSSIKNAVEDKTGRSLLVSKVRPDPDPVDPDPAVVQPTEPEAEGEQNPDFHSVPESLRPSRTRRFTRVPRGFVLIAVPVAEVGDDDEVVGYTV